MGYRRPGVLPGQGETTFEFIEGVLAEVLELFPSEYIHIGGDECPMTFWQKCPHCAARMRSEGLTEWRQLQNYATARVERFLNAHGRRLIGWDEILEGDVTPRRRSCRGAALRAACVRPARGNRAIMSPGVLLPRLLSVGGSRRRAARVGRLCVGGQELLVRSVRGPHARAAALHYRRARAT